MPSLSGTSWALLFRTRAKSTTRAPSDEVMDESQSKQGTVFRVTDMQGVRAYTPKAKDGGAVCA